MRTILLAGLLVAITLGTSLAQLPAQKGTPGKGNRPTAAPPGKKVTAEPTKATATMTKKQGNTETAAVMALTSVDYMIGITGYPSADGVVVMSTVRRHDLDANKIRCAAAEIPLDLQGNGKLITVTLEPGDKITHLGVYGVTTVEQIAIAINTATDPHSLDIRFIDWRTGNEYAAKIDAMRVK